jgi:hypothetical protein
MSRALSRSLAVVALLAVVSATLVVVSPSLARIADPGRPHRSPQPSWLWDSHIYGGTPASTTPAGTKPAETAPHAKHSRRPYKPPVDRWSQP